MKNNRNKFFSISLYKDALKQLRIIGIVLAVVMGYMPIATGMMVGDHLFFTDKIDCILYLFTTSVVMIYIFRFTTKRKASVVYFICISSIYMDYCHNGDKCYGKIGIL